MSLRRTLVSVPAIALSLVACIPVGSGGPPLAPGEHPRCAKDAAADALSRFADESYGPGGHGPSPSGRNVNIGDIDGDGKADTLIAATNDDGRSGDPSSHMYLYRDDGGCTRLVGEFRASRIVAGAPGKGGLATLTVYEDARKRGQCTQESGSIRSFEYDGTRYRPSSREVRCLCPKYAASSPNPPECGPAGF